MIIEVCSLSKAQELVKRTAESVSIVSITSKGEPDVSFPDLPHIESILHLKFNDLMDEYDKEGIPYGRPLPKQEDLTGLKMFVSNLTCDRLIVHCWEGRSRSAAVGRAIYEYRGRIDEFHSGRNGNLNWLVYELACEELK